MPIDLRSDTVTRPTDGMRAAMASAAVGDDQFGEDPSINELQTRVAALLGKESALWLPSGTMANQVALRVLTRPGDDVIVGWGAHAAWSESGASAANAGVQFTEVGAGGTFTAEAFLAARKPRGHILLPPTTLLEIENTHNRGGGVIFPQADVIAICAAARRLNVPSFLDGARLFNVTAATGTSLAALAAPFDVISVALSKGLGCEIRSANDTSFTRHKFCMTYGKGGNGCECGDVSCTAQIFQQGLAHRFLQQRLVGEMGHGARAFNTIVLDCTRVTYERAAKSGSAFG